MEQVAGGLREERSIWRAELDDLVRGISGGFLFGIPLLYTMEVWWLGTHTDTARLLLLLGFAFGINWMLSSFAGFRKESPPAGAMTDALEAMAIGVVAAAVTLAVLGEVRPGDPLRVFLGKVALESVPFSLGVSIANGFLHGSKSEPGGGEGEGGADDDSDGEGESEGNDGGGQPSNEEHAEAARGGTLRDAGATVAGALFIAFSIAPTEEVPMLAANLSSWGVIGLICFSLVVSYGITFEAGFADQEARMRQQGLFQRPISETVFSYLVALLVAAILLFVFKQVDFSDPWHVWLDYAVVLGLPAAIGGSAGRLAVGG